MTNLNAAWHTTAVSKMTRPSQVGCNNNEVGCNMNEVGCNMKSRSKTPSSHPPRASQTRKAGAVTSSQHGTMSAGHKKSVTSHYRALSAGGGGVGDVGYGEREREPLIGQWLRWQQTRCHHESEHHQHAAHTDAQAQMHSRPATSLGISYAISYAISLAISLYIHVCSCLCL